MKLANKTQFGYGFTLVELMTVVAIIGILTSILLPSLAAVRAKARRIGCINNLQQMGKASMLYADDDSRGRFSNTYSDGDDNLNWLYPNYISVLNTFICPSTDNIIRPSSVRTDTHTNEKYLLDLAFAADDPSAYGSSYEVYGFMNYNGDESTIIQVGNAEWLVSGVQKTINSTLTYQHKNDSFGLKGIIPGPSKIWLFLDGDKSYGNYPSSESNHGSGGNNVEFCDGHVEWVRTDSWLVSYETSQDEDITARGF